MRYMASSCWQRNAVGMDAGMSGIISATCFTASAASHAHAPAVQRSGSGGAGGQHS